MFKVGDIVILNDNYYNNYLNNSVVNIFRNYNFEIIKILPNMGVALLSNDKKGMPEYMNIKYIDLDITYLRKQKLKKLLECSK